ncbi:hypothetical protein [Bacillus sp. CH30_1T]|nr:hypothetical protein [Bacillus sp. CH30_1T]
MSSCVKTIDIRIGEEVITILRVSFREGLKYDNIPSMIIADTA